VSENLSRRVLVRALFAAPLVGAAAAAGAAAARSVRASRPAASGSSSTRCALCGSADHQMLDRGCPATKAVV